MGSNVYLTPAGSQGFAPHWCVVVPGGSLYPLSEPAGNLGACCLHITKHCSPLLDRSLPHDWRHRDHDSRLQMQYCLV